MAPPFNPGTSGTVRAFAVVTVFVEHRLFLFFRTSVPFHKPTPHTTPSADFCRLVREPCDPPSLEFGTARQISRGKFLRLPRTTAEFTFCVLDGCGLRCQLPARPTRTPQIRFLYVGSRVCSMLLSDASSRKSPLHFANPSPPSGWIRDLHPQAEKHARHTTQNMLANGQHVQTLQIRLVGQLGQLGQGFSDKREKMLK